jgi:hypothetical protein
LVDDSRDGGSRWYRGKKTTVKTVNAVTTQFGGREEQAEETVLAKHLTGNPATNSALRQRESPSLQGDLPRANWSTSIHSLILAVVGVALPRFRTNHGLRTAQWKRTL